MDIQLIEQDAQDLFDNASALERARAADLARDIYARLVSVEHAQQTPMIQLASGALDMAIRYVVVERAVWEGQGPNALSYFPATEDDEDEYDECIEYRELGNDAWDGEDDECDCVLCSGPISETVDALASGESVSPEALLAFLKFFNTLEDDE